MKNVLKVKFQLPDDFSHRLHASAKVKRKKLGNVIFGRQLNTFIWNIILLNAAGAEDEPLPIQRAEKRKKPYWIEDSL